MGYVGTVGQKITAEVTLVREYEYKDYKFSYYGTNHYIYTMKDDDGNIFVWKTTSCMAVKMDKKKEDHHDYVEDGYYWYVIKKRDRIRITGKVKEHSIFNCEEQTVLTRCKIELVEREITYEERREMKQKEQLDTLKEGDLLWTIPYKQYKEHYADCETLYGSYDDHERESQELRKRISPTITIIVRFGRLKNSGTRFQHYSGYMLENEEGKWVTYRAVNEDNAKKRAYKDFPEHTWTVKKVYDYQRNQWF